MNMPIFMVIDDENVLLLKARHIYKMLGQVARLTGKGARLTAKGARLLGQSARLTGQGATWG